MFRRRHVEEAQEGESTAACVHLRIRSHREGDTHVVQPIGELDMFSAPDLEDEMRRVEATDARRIVVDLSGLESMDSDGLKVFIQASARSRRAGDRLTLMRGPDHVHSTFETTGLVSRLPFASDQRRFLPGFIAC